MTKKMLIMGAGCFSAQDFIDNVLSETDYQVIGVGRSAEPKDVFLKYKTNKRASDYRYTRYDFISQMNDFLQFLDEFKPHYIVNFTALGEVATSWTYPSEYMMVNAVMVAELVNHLRQQDYLERYLHIGSPEAYGTCFGNIDETTVDNPSTPYALSKSAGEMMTHLYHKQYGFPSISIRATNVYGARQQLFKIIPRTIIYSKLRDKVQLHGGGKAIKSFIHIRDVSRGELSALQNGSLGERYHLSPDQGISIVDLVAMIANILGYNFDQLTEIVGERPGQDAAYIIDSSKARNQFNWLPKISLQEGLEETITWLNQCWDVIKDEPFLYEHRHVNTFISKEALVTE